jgi:hypothetical protein
MCAPAQARLYLQDHNRDHTTNLAKADRMYEAALELFPESATVHVLYAQYLHSYKKNRHLEMAQLSAAERKVCACVVVGVWRRTATASPAVVTRRPASTPLFPSARVQLCSPRCHQSHVCPPPSHVSFGEPCAPEPGHRRDVSHLPAAHAGGRAGPWGVGVACTRGHGRVSWGLLAASVGCIPTLPAWWSTPYAVDGVRACFVQKCFPHGWLRCRLKRRSPPRGPLT